MPARTLRAAVGTVWLLAAVLRAGRNLAPNSSFEEGLGAWSLWQQPGAQAGAALLLESPRHGKACAAVRSGAGRAVLHSDPIEVRPEADYTLSAYARTRSAADAGLALWVLGEAGAAPGGAWDPEGSLEAANLLANPGFEEGTRGWQLWHGAPGVSSGGVQDGGPRGGKAFHVLNPGTQGANLHSDPVPCQAGTAYQLSVHARVRAGSGVGIAVWARDAAGKTLSYAVEGTRELPADVPEFRRFAVAVTAPPGSAELKAHLICNGGEVWWDDVVLAPLSLDAGYEMRCWLDLPGEQPAWARFRHVVRTPAGCRAVRILLISGPGEVHWDAVQLEPGREPSAYAHVSPVAGPNRLPNADFEDGPAGWTLWRQNPDQSAGSVEEGAGRGGGRAFHVRNPGPGGANLFSDPVPCEPGATMTLSAHARVLGGRGVQVAVWAVDGAGETLSYAVEGPVDVPADVPDYTRFAKTVTVPERAAGLRAHLICNAGEVWWDDVQLEPGPAAGVYAPGPRIDVLRPSFGPAAAAYTGALLREARLRDVLAQSERLVLYAPAPRRMALEAPLEAARRAVEAVTDAVGAPFLVPPYRQTDFRAVEELMDAAQARLEALWRDCGHDPSGAFEPWDPDPLPPNLDRAALAREFVVFPCFTRPDFFRGEGNWDVLAPFRFRLVSGWWGIGCDAEGTPHAGGLEEVLELCSKHGYPCDIGLDPAQAAASALGSREEFFLHNAEGGWSPAGNCHNTVSIWHPDIRRLAARFAQNTAARFAGDPRVLCWEMTNEPSLTIEQHEHGYAYRPAGVGGYEPAAVAAWQAWLAARHGTIAELNRRWRTAYAGFAEIRPPADLRPPAPASGDAPVPVGPLHDFLAFRAASHAEWFRLCLEAFRRGDPHKAVISQFYSPAIERKDAAVDLRALAEEAPWDFFGTHDWPGDRPAVDSLYAVSMNRLARRPHWEDEFIWSQWERKGTPEPVMRAALERNLWRQAAWGKRGISLFNLESEWAHDSPQNWNNSLLNLEADLEVPRYSTGILPTFERKIHRVRETLYATELGPVEAAILRPTASTLTAAPDGRVRREAVAAAEFLLRRHEVPLFVPEEHLAAGPAPALEGVRVLVAPWAVHVPVPVQESLLAWVRGGGVLACSGPFGLFDQYGTPAGVVLRAAFGDLRWTYDPESARWQAQPPEPGTALPRSASCGLGRVVLFEHSLLEPAGLEELAACHSAAIPVPLVSTALPDLEILPRVNAEGERFLIVTNLDARRPRAGEVRVRGRFAEAVELSCECSPRIPLEPAGGTTSVPLRLAPGTGVFLRLGRPG